jgi:hypothetical protein
MAAHHTVVLGCDGHYHDKRCWEFLDTHEDDIRKARECAEVFGWKRLLVDERDNYADICPRVDHDEETQWEPGSTP